MSPAARCARGCGVPASWSKPLVELMTERVRQSQVIHTDDTTVPIQSPGAKQCRKGRIWCYLGDEANPYTVYDYTPSRSRDGPAKWLAGFTGYLQADAYGGYDGIFQAASVTEVACWAHARRKFYDAQDSDEQRAAQMLALIGRVVRRSSAKRRMPTTRRGSHCAKSGACRCSTRIKTWLDAEQEVVLPRSPMAAAITYAQNQWQALDDVRDARLPEHRQQRQRAGAEAGGHRPQELALRRPRRRGREPRPAVVADRQRRTPRRRSAALPHQRAGQDRPDAAGNWSSSCPTCGKPRMPASRCPRLNR